MMAWLQANFGNILVVTILAGLAGWIIYRAVKRSRSGCHGCSGCAASAQCAELRAQFKAYKEANPSDHGSE